MYLKLKGFPCFMGGCEENEANGRVFSKPHDENYVEINKWP